MKDKLHKKNTAHATGASGEQASAYKEAGVDIDAGNDLVKRIKDPVKKTFGPGVMTDIGGFGALFDLKKTGFADPLLVSATDGVGTKLRLAIETGRHDTIGIDLVAMCVNDLLAIGATPLFFLDYYACGHLNVDEAESVINGIAAGCREAGCSLIGGETAEMPGMYSRGDYDLAGFAVGAVERGQVIDGSTIKPGDTLIGLASSGPHSNGYSLIRKIIADHNLALDDPAPFSPTQTLVEALLTPTRIYTESVLKCLKDSPGMIKGIAHITGGGLTENIARILPADTTADLDALSWPFPPLFSWLTGIGNLAEVDLEKTFNCGLGLVLVCDPDHAKTLTNRLEEQGEDVFEIGRIKENRDDAPPVVVQNRRKAWRSKD